MTRGGYRIVDLKNISLNGTLKDVPGVFASIDQKHKARLLTNINIGGVQYHDTFIDPVYSSSKYTFTVYGYNFEVTSGNKVKVTVVS